MAFFSSPRRRRFIARIITTPATAAEAAAPL
jgi:hypothetical protein